MKKLIIYLLIGVILAIVSVGTYAQEVTMYAGRGQPAAVAPEGNDEVQDEVELASALGIDRRALYEDLMRIQEELGGSPFSEQSSQEQEQEQEDYN